MSNYPIATQRALRAAFWRDHKGVPGITPRRITNYSGNGKMHNTDTRCAFVDWLDAMSRNGQVSDELAQRATL
jgi:hypothetical protein